MQHSHMAITGYWVHIAHSTSGRAWDRTVTGCCGALGRIQRVQGSRSHSCMTGSAQPRAESPKPCPNMTLALGPAPPSSYARVFSISIVSVPEMGSLDSRYRSPLSPASCQPLPPPPLPAAAAEEDIPRLRASHSQQRVPRLVCWRARRSPLHIMPGLGFPLASEEQEEQEQQERGGSCQRQPAAVASRRAHVSHMAHIADLFSFFGAGSQSDFY